MFLGMLNEKEQKNFMELASIAMNVDGKVDESERQVMDVYRRETNLLDYKLQNKKESELVTAFQASTKKVKKAVIIELAGVLDADEVIDGSEESWILKIGTEWTKNLYFSFQNKRYSEVGEGEVEGLCLCNWFFCLR